MNAKTLVTKALAVGLAVAAITTVGATNASADISTSRGGYAHTEATCHSYQHTMFLNVHMYADRDTYPQYVNFVVDFYRWNSTTARWDKAYVFSSGVHTASGSMGYAFTTRPFVPGYYFAQVGYAWARYDGMKTHGTENLQYYRQDHHATNGSQYLVKGYCQL